MTTHSPTQNVLTSIGRRQFLRASAAAGGGLLINFSWLGSSLAARADADSLPDKLFSLNAFIRIASNGVITAMVPNPEFGQNLMTSMPMILAEELDADWQSISAEQAPYDPALYQRQFSGGSQSIRQAWSSLRMAGAAARHMLMQAAAGSWNVPMASLTTHQGTVKHTASGKQASYGELASLAATLPVPENVAVKSKDSFTLIGSAKKNLVGQDIVTGKPLFGMDTQVDGMLIAMIVHAPAFGQTLASADTEAIKSMPGIRDVFVFDSIEPEYTKNYFDVTAFPTMVAIVGDSTWQVIKAKKALNAQWKTFDGYEETIDRFGSPAVIKVPGGLESTAGHKQAMEDVLSGKAGKLDVLRRDGNPEAAFEQAAQIVESTYYAPYLAHNTMEPMNFFADATGEVIKVSGPLQGPIFIRQTLAERLKVSPDNIEIDMKRMGGGFGRRAYSHYLVEAAVISKKVNKPVKLIYTREDDMTMGIYRPTYSVKLRAALSASKELIAYHVSGVGVPEHCVHENRFPAGAIEHYLAEGTALDSNITVGAFRAPRSNFMAMAEQAFLDEVAEVMGQDPIDLRLSLLKRAQQNPVGSNNDYDAARYAGVLHQLRETAGWDSIPATTPKGVAVYYCHNSYAAHVVTLSAANPRNPQIDNVFSVLDCGIVVNTEGAVNMVEGAVIDGIGNAMYGEMTFTDGKPDKQNFDRYRMIRMNEIPRNISVSFVQSDTDPTGLGEPPFPPIFPALANALYQATGKRLYEQPFAPQIAKG
ncbi:molybdopterin cofactor-binding domain-containing protein [Alteromonas sp. AMM-1]|uniref:xanthine dehydrogenase family protein molybdopterin-binding subunit n=1 Tax=Alteromonas sp. AMM-1 TaxID=3394233 RepID=UPI0039A7061B